MSSKGIKIDPVKSSVGGFHIGDSICKVLAYIQINVQAFGKIDIISSKDDAKNPTFILLPESGKYSRYFKFQVISFKYAKRYYL